MKRSWKAPDIREIERREREENHFARGLNGYKLFWIFFLGCFLGVLIETIWSVVTWGRLEWRAGLVWGPFNLVYGFGTLALGVGLYWLRDKRDGYILLGGALIGSGVEYVCSWVQERLFGSISWDYSGMPFNLHGRINLLYSLFWGILAILWVKDVYPRLARLILKIPNRVGKPLTWVLLVFMVLNTVVSAAAVGRWADRLAGVPPQNQVEELLDQRFPDQRMKWIYPNMKFLAEED